MGTLGEAEQSASFLVVQIVVCYGVIVGTSSAGYEKSYPCVV